MAWRVWVWGAVVAVAMAGEAAGEVRAASVDCWLLDGDRKAQAADAGLCDDAFSRNSKPGEPPALGPTASLPEPPLPPAPPPAPPVAAPPRKPDPKPASLRRHPTSGGPHGSRGTPARLPRGGSGDDFASRFQRDFGALVDLLGGGSAGHRSDGASAYPSHNGR